jgi:hypothetical protein
MELFAAQNLIEKIEKLNTNLSLWDTWDIGYEVKEYIRKNPAHGDPLRWNPVSELKRIAEEHKNAGKLNPVILEVLDEALNAQNDLPLPDTLAGHPTLTNPDEAHMEVIRQHAMVDAISFVRDIGKGTAKMKPGENLSPEMYDDFAAAINDYVWKYHSVLEIQKAVFVEGGKLNPTVLKFLNENLAFIQERLEVGAVSGHSLGNYPTEHPVEGK